VAVWLRLMLDWERWTLTQSSGGAGVPVLVTTASRVAAVLVALEVLPVAVDVPDGDTDGDGDCEVVFSVLLTLGGGDTMGE
jgi:hypothetical protein